MDGLRMSNIERDHTVSEKQNNNNCMFSHVQPIYILYGCKLAYM